MSVALPAAPLWVWAATLVLAVVLLAIARRDLAEFRVPDALSLPLVPAGLAVTWGLGGDLALHVLGAALGWGSFALIGAFYFRWRGRDGLGRGDAKLLGGAGAWLGPGALPLLVLLAALGALVFALATRCDRHGALAFAPWLCAGFFTLWLARLAGWR